MSLYLVYREPKRVWADTYVTSICVVEAKHANEAINKAQLEHADTARYYLKVKAMPLSIGQRFDI